MTRVYVPTSLAGLAVAQESGVLRAPNGDPDKLPAHAVTPAVREWYVEGNVEELEFTALIDAAEASLSVLAVDPGTPRRRVVIAADVPDTSVRPSGTSRSSVLITGSIALSRVVSVHVDELESVPIITAAVEAVAAAAAGDDDARFLLDEAEACDLLWYDISEIDDLIE